MLELHPIPWWESVLLMIFYMLGMWNWLWIGWLVRTTLRAIRWFVKWYNTIEDKD
jgi:hypothetical protein